MHDVCPASEKLPARHAVAEELPDAHEDPAGHVVQTERDAVRAVPPRAYVPPGQTWHVFCVPPLADVKP